MEFYHGTINFFIKKHTETCHKRFISIQEREIECLSSENKGIAPTVDRHGRLHAGCDEYNDVNGNVYIKGQFIPMPELEDECFFGFPSFAQPLKSRIQVSGDTIQKLQNILSKELDGVKFRFR